MSQSEVARLREQIELECSAIQQATGFASVTTHEIISHRYDAIGDLQQQMATLVGDDEATAYMVDAYAKAMEG